ncbi:MAG: hypothetical protein LBR76_06070, partial [Oscillospiraceae bacterium]|nr:hypothetical protein [Oscillospiraceae bacterium]
IAEKVIIHYPNDWTYDAEELRKIAVSTDPEEKRLLWHVCDTGTHLKKERDVFVRDSGAFDYMTDYHQNDPDMFGYAVEVTGLDGNTVKGNIFEVGGYARFAAHIRDNALRMDTVTLTYSDAWGVNAGKTITVSRKEYDKDRHRLMSESGNVVKTRFNPTSEAELGELLRQEHAKRMSLPLGSAGELLRKVADRLKEVRQPPEQAAKPPAQKRKPSLLEQLASASAEAAAYNAQRAQNPSKTKNNREELS